MSAIIVATPPAIEPVYLVDVKNFLRVDHRKHNMLIIGLIRAARLYCEKFTRRALISTKFVQYHDHFPYWNAAGKLEEYVKQIKLYRPPCLSVEKIVYRDPNNEQQTLLPYNADTNPTGFLTDVKSNPARVFPAVDLDWPSTIYQPNAVEIHFTAGYGDRESDVPQPIILAIMALVDYWYKHRDEISDSGLKEAPMYVDALLWEYRVLDLDRIAVPITPMPSVATDIPTKEWSEAISAKECELFSALCEVDSNRLTPRQTQLKNLLRSHDCEVARAQRLRTA
jgi:uncharacterized phiE125 gp8 family phage protein